MGLHGKIMNIHPMMNDTMYKLGHRDARHAAAELAITETAALRQSHAELLEAVKGLLSITYDSDGVAGYHLNGDIADWNEFDEVNQAAEAIAKAEALQEGKNE